MLKQQATIIRRVALALDNVVLVVAFMLAYYLRRSEGAVGGLHSYDWILLFALPIWYFLSNHFKLYESLRIRSTFSIVQIVFKVHAIGGISLSAVIFMIDPHYYSRLLFLTFILISFLLTATCKVLIKLTLKFIRRKGYNSRNVLIVGTGENALKVSKLVHEHQEWGIINLGLVALTDEALLTTAGLHPVVGTIKNLIEICKEKMADEVIFANQSGEPYDFGELFQELQDLGLTVRAVIDYRFIRSSRTEVSFFNNEIPMFTYSNISLNSDQLLAKRCMDVIGALVGLTMTALMLPIIALAIKIDSRGPVFFGQTRIRENGRRFTCWKFRSMSVDAEEKKKELMALNEMNGAMFKVKNDPRVTAVGRFLRKTSLDEFPQFWNVLVGEMSLVGTRPPTPDEVATYENWHRRRISIKPGITGMWQVCGRNQVQDFDDVVRLDLVYIETWTIWLDIRLLLKTPWVMLSRRGAS